MQSESRQFLTEVVARKSQILLLNPCLRYWVWRKYHSEFLRPAALVPKRPRLQVFILEITSDSTLNVDSQLVKAECWTQNGWLDGLTRLWNPLPPQRKRFPKKQLQVLVNVDISTILVRLQVRPLLVFSCIAKTWRVFILLAGVCACTSPSELNGFPCGLWKTYSSLGRTLKTRGVQDSLVMWSLRRLKGAKNSTGKMKTLLRVLWLIPKHFSF